MQATQDGTVSATEVARFDALAADWWDPRGPMRPLHAMNPARAAWVDARLPRAARILDVGCGAGLLAEALAKEGHHVTGLDAAGAAIAAARAHAAEGGLDITYREGLAEELLAEGARFDAVTALEVVEHVPNPARFIATTAGLLNPGGRLFLSTLNRTARSFLVAKLGAEYVLRLLPIGTHDWQAFLKPSELARHVRAAGLAVDDMAGLAPGLDGIWRTTSRTAVNYLMTATAPSA